MNIKQRRCLSEMTGSSSLSPFVQPHYLSPYLYVSYPCTQLSSSSFYFPCMSSFNSAACVQHDVGPRSKINAAKKHKYSSGECISFDMLTLYINPSFLMSGFCFSSCVLSRVMFSASITNSSVHHHQNNAPCKILQLGAEGADTEGAKVFQWFKYLIVNDKHHFTTI